MGKSIKLFKYLILTTSVIVLSSCSGNGGESETPKEKSLVSLDFSGSLNKSKYFVGEKFDPSGLVFIATYSNNGTADVTSSVSYSVEYLEEDTTQVIASYTYKNVTLEKIIDSFTVSAIETVKLEVKGNLVNKNYYAGDVFNPSGLTFYAVKNNGEKENVTGKVTFSKTALDVDDTSITATYETFSVEITGFNVKKLELINISSSGTLTKTNYFEGDMIDLSGLTFIATYSNESTKDVTDEVVLTNSKVSYGDTSFTVYYTFNGVTKYCGYQGITVAKIVLDHLSISGALTKTSYIEGDYIDLSGLCISAVYSNGDTKDVTNSVSLSKGKLSFGDTKITAFYVEGDVAKNIQITGFEVKKNGIASLTFGGVLKKSSYYEDENIDLTGLTFTVSYLNGTSKDVTDLVVVKTTLIEGITSIEVSYSEDGIERSCEIPGISVTKDVILSFTYSGTLRKAKYNEGENISLAGLTFFINYKSGRMVDVTDLITLDKETLTEGETSLGVSVFVNGETKTLFVNGFTVIKNVLTSLSYNGTLQKTNYIEGDKISLEGLIFTAHFKDETSYDVTNYVTIEKETTSYGDVSFVVSYVEDNVKKSVEVTGINVSKNELTSLSVSGTLQKTTYNVDEELDLTGLTFTATYLNGLTKDVTSQVKPESKFAVANPVISYTEDSITKSVNLSGIKLNVMNKEDGITFNVGYVEQEGDAINYYIREGNDPIFKVEAGSGVLISSGELTDSKNKLNKNLNAFYFYKGSTGQTKFYLGQDFIKEIGELGFSFDLYTSIGINSKSNVSNLTDGKGQIIRINSDYQHPSDYWVHYEFGKDRISEDGCFLITKGSTNGEYYFDNIRVITGKEEYTDLGNLYFESEESITLPAKKDLTNLNQVFVDGKPAPEDKYTVNGSNIVLDDELFNQEGFVNSGEHNVTYNIRHDNFTYEREHLYFGLNKSISQFALPISLDLNYGDQGYTEFSFIPNKLVCNGKSIAFEENDNGCLIPNATLVECLETKDNKKVSGEITLFIIGMKMNVLCMEQHISINLLNDSTIKDQRTYHTDETYHSFGYSSTSGGNSSHDLLSEDLFMLYKRSGLDCIYEQCGHIPAELNDLSFTEGGNAGGVQKDFELCNKLGIGYYVIDSFMRGLIANWDEKKQDQIIGVGCKFATERDFIDAIIARLELYGNNPCLKKIVICDEPAYFSLEVVGQVYKCTQQALKEFGRPDVEVDANLNPISAGYGSETEVLGPAITMPNQDGKNYPTRTATYRNYLSKFIECSGADYISYDIYPLKKGTLNEFTYANLIIAAEFAKERNIELHVVTESFTNCDYDSKQNRRLMSRDDMHYLCNMLMGFGVTRVSFFTYFARWNSDSFNPGYSTTGDRNGCVGAMMHEVYDENNNLIGYEQTDVWYQVQGMLQEMNEFKDVSLNFSYVTSNFIKSSSIKYAQTNAAIYAEQVDKDSFSYGPLNAVSVDKEYALTSTLVDDYENYMYMIQNVCDPKYESLQTVTMSFSSGEYVIIYENGTSRVVNIVDNKITLKLSSGNAAFVMIY